LAAISKLICALSGMPLILGLPMPRLILNRADLNWVLDRNRADKYSSGGEGPLENAAEP
jgi:hypothetical protein